MTARDLVARPIARVARLPILAPLGIRDFRLVWFGEAVSLLGDQFQTVAVAWLVLGLTGSGLALGSILVAAAIPRGIFLLLGGVLADRVSPRDLAFGSNLLRAVLTTVVAGLVLGAQVQLWHLALVGALFGTVDAVFWPAINTLVPRLVPTDRLAAANALMQGTGQLAGTIGPALAGFAVALIGVGAAYVIDAASFVIAAVALWLVRSGATAARPAPVTETETTETAADPHATIESPRPSIATALIEGARAVLGDPVMRSIVILSTGVNLAFTGPVVVGLPWLVLVRFGGDAAALGLLFAGFGAGSLVGVLLGGSLPRPRRFGWLVLGLVIGMGIGLGAIGLAPSVVSTAAILVVIGTMNGYVNVVMIAWVQEKTEPAMLGRTMSFLMLGSVVAAPLSIAVAAVLVDADATVMFLAAGALVVVCGLIAMASGLPRRMTATAATMAP
ncbi:MAG: MFS transporter [Chloroflexota bacterium]